MNTEFPLDNVLMLIGAAQGALISALILQKHRALFANRFLAGMMIVISAILVHLVIEDRGWYSKVRFLFPIFLALPLTVSPLHYFYARYLTDRRSRFEPEAWIHFAPFVITALLSSFFLMNQPMQKNLVVDQNDMTNYPPFLLMFNWALICQGSIYVFFVLKIIGRYDRLIKDVYSSIERVQLRWLRNITLLAAVAWFVFFVENSFLTFGINISSFMISSLLIAAYLYALGYLGILKSEVLETLPAADKIAIAGGKVLYQDERDGTGGKYEKSGLSDEAALRYKEALLRLLEEKKLYTQNNLTLPELAMKLDTSPHNLSEVINSRLNKSFYDIINEYRIEQVKKDLADPAKKNLKLLSIAFDAGFNSKASFNTIFKHHTHLTPSEFRKQLFIKEPAK